MNTKKLLAGTFLQLLLFTGLKYYFFTYIDFTVTMQLYIFLVLAALSAFFSIRIMGVLNFFESFFVCLVWFVVDILIDIIFTASNFGYKIFLTKELWLGYFVFLASVILFHEKLHIKIRKKHQAHGGHH